MDQEFLMKDKEGIFYELKVSNMKTFDDLEFKEHPNKLGGIAARIMFDNGYGASIAQTPFSYGGRDGLYELAVLDEEGSITYETSVTDDVEGYLDPKEVTDLMKLIQEL